MGYPLDMKKKTILYSLIFPLSWILYSLYVIITNASNQTFMGLSGLIIGSLFMLLCGWILLTLIQTRPVKTKALVLTGAALLLLDLGIKQLVYHFIHINNPVRIFGSWLQISFSPNYNNNVLLNLLNIHIDSRWFHVIIKLLLSILMAFLIYKLCRSEGYDMADSKFRWGCMLISVGAVSSIIESGIRGYVLDFISFANMVSFDIKDLCLLFGIGLFIIAFVQWEKESKQRRQKDCAENQPIG